MHRPTVFLITGLLGLAASVTGLALHAPRVSAGTYSPKEMLVVTGFTVEITGAGTGGDVDSSWESVSGGSLNIEVADSSVGSDQVQTTTPGQKYVDTLVLRGPLTGAKRSVACWERSVRHGKKRPRRDKVSQFAVDIEGAPVSSANVESISVEDLVIDERETTPGASWDYRTYAPGDAHYGSITIHSRVSKNPNNSGELAEWFQETAVGKPTRKQVTIVALGCGGEVVREYDFYACTPVGFQPHMLQDFPQVALEGITVRCEGFEFVADGQDSALAAWINATVQAKDWQRNLTIKELTRNGAEGRVFKYLDAFPSRYVFPAFSASASGNLYEEISIKPIRLELN